MDSQVIIGVVSHDEHEHDSKTLKPALEHARLHRKTDIKVAVVDKGNRGRKQYVSTEVLLPSKLLKKGNRVVKPV